MKIAIDASRAFLNKKTGIEEYAYRIVRGLRKDLENHEVILYLRKGGKAQLEKSFDIPEKWEAREISFNYFWTQIGMAWEFLIDSPDVLLIPAHTVPWIHPKNSVVVIHGLEYEHCPESYSLYSRIFHRFFIKKSCRWASEIIAISKNTKKDLIEMYETPAEKITVVYNGFTEILKDKKGDKKRENNYLLFLGRIEKRKNIGGMVEAFEILKEKYNYKGQLVLAGKPGYNYQAIESKIKNSKYRKDIILKGYVDDAERFSLVKNADLFLFPSFCEGFGLPILEAQSVQTPVLTSDIGPMNEIAGSKNILADPNDSEDIARVAFEILDDNEYRKKVIAEGAENVKSFSWGKCSEGIAKVLLRQNEK